MEELFEQLKRAITPFTAPAAKRATAMDSITERMADAAAASYIASVAEDADFKEEDHPRNTKGGMGGGRFRTSGKTIEKEDYVGPVYKDAMSALRKLDADFSVDPAYGEGIVFRVRDYLNDEAFKKKVSALARRYGKPKGGWDYRGRVLGDELIFVTDPDIDTSKITSL